MRRALHLTGVTVMLAAVITLFAPGSAAAASAHVMIAQYAYGPSTVTVTAGDTVSWTNHDQAPHDVVTTSGPAQLRSPMMSNGQSWSFRFTQPGTYSYYCSVHPDMKAKVVVLPASAPPQAPPPVQQPQRPPAQQPGQQQPRTTVPPRPGTTRAPAAPVPGVPAPAPQQPIAQPAADQQVVTQPQAQQEPVKSLDPMLLVAGVIAAVATLCLMLIASRPG
ncbi:amicyanin [Herbihabitans rhizosphaerae]|uniref:Amicyanin n=1 Tax=Herbihabitans rhizosphaerae TaxID=1872711 RepID=A0A4Q7KEI9_9PSEU|nr:cupredoxin family copper-binding protein [Herbihabitans rhizosphaerae]RZS31260.1 amicyanin [Herbihabitans rhizosphaerae]